MEKYDEFFNAIESLKADFEKFYVKGNAAAGARIRKGLQEIAANCKATRKEVTELKAARKASV